MGWGECSVREMRFKSDCCQSSRWKSQPVFLSCSFFSEIQLKRIQDPHSWMLLPKKWENVFLQHGMQGWPHREAPIWHRWCQLETLLNRGESTARHGFPNCPPSTSTCGCLGSQSSDTHFHVLVCLVMLHLPPNKAHTTLSLCGALERSNC